MNSLAQLHQSHQSRPSTSSDTSMTFRCQHSQLCKTQPANRVRIIPSVKRELKEDIMRQKTAGVERGDIRLEEANQSGKSGALQQWALEERQSAAQAVL